GVRVRVTGDRAPVVTLASLDGPRHPTENDRAERTKRAAGLAIDLEELVAAGARALSVSPVLDRGSLHQQPRRAIAGGNALGPVMSGNVELALVFHERRRRACPGTVSSDADRRPHTGAELQNGGVRARSTGREEPDVD